MNAPTISILKMWSNAAIENSQPHDDPWVILLWVLTTPAMQTIQMDMAVNIEHSLITEHYLTMQISD